MLQSEEQVVCTCGQIAVERKGVCPKHLLAPVDEKVMEEIDRRRQAIIRRYVIEAIPPAAASETVSEEVSERAWLQIQEMKDRLRLKTFDEVISLLGKEMSFRYDPSKVLETRTPLVITGLPQSGKTVLCKRILQDFERVFVVDVSHEYEGFDIVTTGDLLGNIWQNKARFRVFPADNPLYSNMEMEFTFGILLGKMKEHDSPLRDFVFVIEDAVRFEKIQSVRSFIAESRKFIRKCIIVCQDPHAFEGLGELVKP